MPDASPETTGHTASVSALPRVVVATTAMLTFISFWRAAAVVLNDLASSAFYACGIAEQAVGKSAPWFILGVMLFAYAVSQMYVESCSMFVRGGIYRVVKEAMGGTLAKLSVSALMFDYILTGPISGVSAGQYLAGFINELLNYAHVDFSLPTNLTAASLAACATLYFWWQNIKGIPVSSEKAAHIMHLTTIMVVLMIGWCGYTLWAQGGHLPPGPRPENLRYSAEALGWLRGSRLLEQVGAVGILIAFGHSVLAMSGLETLAQVYREIEHPKLPNLKKSALVIFIYSLVFTSLVSFFAVMIIPDATRPSFKDNLIGGLAMHVVGPLPVRLVFHAFVVVVGILILAGAVNTAIVGSNGVLNRVSEDGVLSAWFRHPHPHFGTSHRIINLVVGLQLLTIFLSRGDVILLGEAYAFGVIWSFAMKGLGVMVLRYTQPGPREFRVPLNLRIGRLETPVGLGLVTLTLLATAVVNLLTKQVATISGIAFTLALFGIFLISERSNQRRGGSRQQLDQFNLEASKELSPQTLGCRPGNVLVLIPDYHKLYHLKSVLDRVKPERHDVAAVHVRVLSRSGSGEHGLEPEQLFTANEQELFTRALSLAEKSGKTIHLAVVPATEIWDGILRAAQALHSSTIVLGLSSKMSAAEEARRVGAAWERLPSPKPRWSAEIYTPSGQEQVFYLGPHAPRLTAKEIDLLHSIWLHFSSELGQEELHHHDIVHFALSELQQELRDGKDQEALVRLRRHLAEVGKPKG